MAASRSRRPVVYSSIGSFTRGSLDFERGLGQHAAHLLYALLTQKIEHRHTQVRLRALRLLDGIAAIHGDIAAAAPRPENIHQQHMARFHVINDKDALATQRIRNREKSGCL